MTLDAIVAAVGIFGGAFAIGAISSVVPIISIEVFLVAVTLARGASDAVLLVVLATLGQVLGKLPIYYSARGLAALPGPHRRWLDRIQAWVARLGNRPNVLLAASAVLGLPPFSMISTAAGALAIPARTFCIVIALGRAARFALLIATVSLSSSLPPTG